MLLTLQNGHYTKERKKSKAISSKRQRNITTAKAVIGEQVENQGQSPKQSMTSMASHAVQPSHLRYTSSGSFPDSQLDISSTHAHYSSKEKVTDDSVEHVKLVDAGSVSYDSSANDNKPNAALCIQEDSLSLKRVAKSNDNKRRSVCSLLEVARDIAQTSQLVISSRDSSEPTSCDVEITRCALEFSAETKATSTTKRKKFLSKSVRIEDVEIQGRAASLSVIDKRRSSSPDEPLIAESLPQQLKFNRSAFSTGTAVKKLCEKRGCWVTGEIADCEEAKSIVCRVEFEVDESVDLPVDQSLNIRSTPKELDLLEKMVKLGRVCVGTRVSIQRSEDDLCYSATVLHERLENRKAFFVQYDDGESEWINLWFHKFQVLEDCPRRNKPKARLSKDIALKREVKDVKITKRKREATSKRLGTVETSDADGVALLREEQESVYSNAKIEVTKKERADISVVNDQEIGKRCKELETQLDLSPRDKEDAKPLLNGSTTLKSKRGRPKNSVFLQPTNENENEILSRVDAGIVSKPDGNSSCHKREAETVSLFDVASKGNEVTKSKRGRPRISEKEIPERPSSSKKAFVVEDDLKSDDIVCMERSEVSAKCVAKEQMPAGTPKNSDLQDTDSEQSEDSIVEASVNSSHGDTEISVGDRVGVYWSGDNKNYYGKVTKHKEGKKKPFLLEYDDGESEWINFSTITCRLVKKKKSSMLVKPRATDESSLTFNANVKSKVDKSESAAFLVAPPLRTKRRSVNANELPSRPRRRKSAVDDAASPTRKKRKLTGDTDSSELIDDVAKITVGTRVSVWWPEDRKYYKGVVTRKQAEAAWRPFFLEYDDGEEEWIDFRQHQFKILSDALEETQVLSPARKTGSPCSDPSKVWIGTRLSVWWPAEKAYFDCTVTRYRNHTRPFYLEYEDGDREWIDLADHTFFIIDN